MRGDYTDWEGIDYQPAAIVWPTGLLDHLAPGQRVLDLGCNKGHVSRELAQRGLDVLGVDINPAAVQVARSEAARQNLESHARFEVVDMTTCPFNQEFDIVLMIRVLTCFPQFDDWERIQEGAYRALADGGLLYINDFVLDQQNPSYARRYEEGQQKGWRVGNFLVRDRAGTPLFIAHHHSDEEIQAVSSRYDLLHSRRWRGLSMNGNALTLFELIGRKHQVDSK